jgi:hypothetical protein
VKVDEYSRATYGDDRAFDHVVDDGALRRRVQKFGHRAFLFLYYLYLVILYR